MFYPLQDTERLEEIGIKVEETVDVQVAACDLITYLPLVNEYFQSSGRSAMNSESRLYKLFSPSQNPDIQARIRKAMLHPAPGLLAVHISRVFQNEKLRKKREMKENSSNEEVIGFHSPFCLLIACAYRAKGPTTEFLVRNNLSDIGDEKVVEVAKMFLDSGAALIRSDTSGRSAMSHGVDHLKTNSSNDDHNRGLDAAKKVYDECFQL